MNLNVNILSAIFFAGTLPFVCGTKPEELIKKYTDEMVYSGNVLAYENIYGQTIVLKSGNKAIKNSKEDKEKDTYVSLEDVVGLVINRNELQDNNYFIKNDTENSKAYLDKYKKTDEKAIKTQKKAWEAMTNNDWQTFGDLCQKNNTNWYDYITTQHPYCIKNCQAKIIGDKTIIGVDGKNLVLDRHYPPNDKNPQYRNFKENLTQNSEFKVDPCEYIKMIYNPNLQSRLGNFRHTEIQVQALLNAYKETSERKSILEALLPKALVSDNDKDKKEPIYSVYEACQACKETAWLNEEGKNRKNQFMFHILDGQYRGWFEPKDLKKLKDGHWIEGIKRKTALTVSEDGFVQQSELEECL